MHRYRGTGCWLSGPRLSSGLAVAGHIGREDEVVPEVAAFIAYVRDDEPRAGRRLLACRRRAPYGCGAARDLQCMQPEHRRTQGTSECG
jgi:hypothetical protein